MSLDKTTVQLAVGSSTQLKLSGASGVRLPGRAAILPQPRYPLPEKSPARRPEKPRSPLYPGGKSDTCTVTVVPKKQKITYSKSQQAGQVTLKWNRQTGVKGYQIRYSTDKSFKKNVKTVTVKKSSTYKRPSPSCLKARPIISRCAPMVPMAISASTALQRFRQGQGKRNCFRHRKTQQNESSDNRWRIDTASAFRNFRNRHMEKQQAFHRRCL